MKYFLIIIVGFYLVNLFLIRLTEVNEFYLQDVEEVRLKWRVDFDSPVDSSLYLDVLTADFIKMDRLCSAKNDTLFILRPYNHSQDKYFKTIIWVGDYSLRIGTWDWYNDIYKVTHPLRNLSL